MSEASRAREAVRHAKPVKFLLICMTPVGNGQAGLTFNTDMNVRDLQAIASMLPGYIEEKLQAAVAQADKQIIAIPEITKAKIK